MYKIRFALWRGRKTKNKHQKREEFRRMTQTRSPLSSLLSKIWFHTYGYPTEPSISSSINEWFRIASRFPEFPYVSRVLRFSHFIVFHSISRKLGQFVGKPTFAPFFFVAHPRTSPQFKSIYNSNKNSIPSHSYSAPQSTHRILGASQSFVGSRVVLLHSAHVATRYMRTPPHPDTSAACLSNPLSNILLTIYVRTYIIRIRKGVFTWTS